MAEILSDTEEFYEWGYRLANGDEWWETDGVESSYIPRNGLQGVAYIELYRGEEAYAIRRALTDAEEEGVVIRRKVTVTRDEPEVVG